MQETNISEVYIFMVCISWDMGQLQCSFYVRGWGF